MVAGVWSWISGGSVFHREAPGKWEVDSREKPERGAWLTAVRKVRGPLNKRQYGKAERKARTTTMYYCALIQLQQCITTPRSSYNNVLAYGRKLQIRNVAKNIHIPRNSV
jgi:hypothetical protein